MKFFTAIKAKLDRLLKRKAVPSKAELLVFENECAFCDTLADGSRLVDIEGRGVPCCPLCEAKLVNGVKWTGILKTNYNDNKRRYCSKYLRIVLWFSDY